VLLGRYSPPGVVIDNDLQIVQTRGKTGAFLELGSGEASLNVLKMAREGVLHGIRSVIKEVRKSNKPARREGLLVKGEGTTREIDIQVFPLSDVADSPHFLVLFEDRAKTREDRAEPAVKRGKGKDDPRIPRLEQELSSSRDYMQSIIQDLEAANEELQSANEEILSSNEELQSTNEELDTAKEELQSTNEELNTVNEELNARNDELSQANADLMNLLSAVPAAIVIVTRDLRIRRFTPLAEHVLNLIPTDVGRPLGNLKPNIDVPDLDELTREVIDTVTIKRLEVSDRSGRFYILQVRPYKDQENRIDGAVISLTDGPPAGA
jgi:two-component system CheB/CheR fusion protein